MRSLPGNTSWLRQLWDDDYLAWRGPLPLNLNYCFRLEAFGKGQDTGLAAFILALARVAALIGRAELEAKKTRSGYQAMDQARSAFIHACRPLARMSYCLFPSLPDRQSLFYVEGFLFSCLCAMRETSWQLQERWNNA